MDDPFWSALMLTPNGGKLRYLFYVCSFFDFRQVAQCDQCCQTPGRLLFLQNFLRRFKDLPSHRRQPGDELFVWKTTSDQPQPPLMPTTPCRTLRRTTLVVRIWLEPKKTNYTVWDHVIDAGGFPHMLQVGHQLKCRELIRVYCFRGPRSLIDKAA